jgi:hypothetical protein
MTEKITRADVEALLFGFIELDSRIQNDGIERWAFDLSRFGMEKAMLHHPSSWYEHHAEHEFGKYKFSNRDAAMRYAFGWLRRNMPNIEPGVIQELRDGIAYRSKSPPSLESK